MALYETIFISRQDMAPSQVDGLTEKYSNLIRDLQGSVGKTEYCGLRTLAYPIKKSGKGHYVLMNITATPKAVQEMERQMRLNEDLLRFLTVMVDEHQDGPSPLLKAARNSNLRDISISFGEESSEEDEVKGGDRNERE
jgi:small subunit ribosomal protein S6